MEDELRQNINQLKNFDNIFDGKTFEIIDSLIIVVDNELSIQYCNKTDQNKLFGYTKKELLTKDLISIIKDDEKNYFRDNFLNNPINEIIKLNIKFKRKNGKYTSYILKGIPLKNQSGYILSLDINLKSSPAHMDFSKNNSTLFESLVKTTSDAIIVSDLKTNIISISEKVLKLSGFEDETSFRGISSFDFIHPDDRKLAKENLLKTLRNGEIKGAKYRFVKKDGGYYRGELNASVIKDPKGNP
ncbi:MAG: PAS domain S-box protein, partial [Promethearchaeota archaeon]